MPPAPITHLDEPTFRKLATEFLNKRPKVNIYELLEYTPVTVEEMNRRFYSKFRAKSVIKTELGHTVNRIVTDTERAARRRR